MMAVMRLAVVSDTHGQVEFTRQAARLIESLDVAQVLHCGDIGSAAIVRLFERWPAHFVFGNVDHDRAALRTVMATARSRGGGRSPAAGAAGAGSARVSRKNKVKRSTSRFYRLCADFPQVSAQKE